MFKIFSTVVVALLILGCGPEKNPHVKSGMFQSVSEDKATLLQEGPDKRYCDRCGMDLVKFYKTSHASTVKDTKHQYCSIHCLEDHLGDGVRVKNPQVVDVESLKFIDVNKAYYVVGSKKRGTMSRVSKYAFADEEMARKFQEKYGGEIMDFTNALERAKEDFR